VIVDEVKRHYVRLFGPPDRNAWFEKDILKVEIFKWGPSEATQEVALYASIGVSTNPMPGHDPSHRLEFFLGFLPELDDVASPLAMVSLEGALHGSAVGPRSSVSYPDPLWAGTEMRSFVILGQDHEDKEGEVIPTLVLPDGLHVDFLQVIPLHDAELDYKLAHGVDALMSEWEKADVPFWDPHRPPLATLAR
jgi:Suppressor of fused protein (SUFU)